MSFNQTIKLKHIRLFEENNPKFNKQSIEMLAPIRLDQMTLKDFRVKLEYDLKIKQEKIDKHNQKINQEKIDNKNQKNPEKPILKYLQVPSDRILLFIKGNFVCSERDFRRALLEFDIKADHFVLLYIQSANPKNLDWQWGNSKYFNVEPSLRSSKQSIHKESVENLSLNELKEFILGLIFEGFIDLHFIMHLEMKILIYKELFENNFKIEPLKDTYSFNIRAQMNEYDEKGISLKDLDKQENTLLHLACQYNSFEWVKQQKDKFRISKDIPEEEYQINRKNKFKLMPIQVAVRQCSLEIVMTLVTEMKDYQCNNLKNDYNCYLITEAMFNQRIDPKLHRLKCEKLSLDYELTNQNLKEFDSIIDDVYGEGMEYFLKGTRPENVIKKCYKEIFERLMDHKNKKEIVLEIIPPKEKEKEKKILDEDFSPFISDEPEPELYPNSFYKWIKEPRGASDKDASRDKIQYKLYWHEFLKQYRNTKKQGKDSWIPQMLYKYSDAHFNCINQWSEDLDCIEDKTIPYKLEPQQGYRYIEKKEVVQNLFNLIPDKQDLNENILQQLYSEDINYNVFEQFMSKFKIINFNIDTQPWSKVKDNQLTQVKDFCKETQFKDGMAVLLLQGFKPDCEYVKPKDNSYQYELYDGERVMNHQSLVQKVEWHQKDTEASTNDEFGNPIDVKPWKNYYSFNGEFTEIQPFKHQSNFFDNKLVKKDEFNRSELFYKHTLLSKIMEGIAHNKQFDNECMMRRIHYITSGHFQKYTNMECLRMVKEIRKNNKELFKCEIQLDKWIKTNEEEIAFNAKKSSKKTHDDDNKSKNIKKRSQEKNHFLDFEKTVMQDQQQNPVASLNSHWQSDLRTPVATSFLFNNAKAYNMPKHYNIVTPSANNLNIPNQPKFNKLFPFANKSKEQDKTEKDKNKREKDEKYNTMRYTDGMKNTKGDDTKRSNNSLKMRQTFNRSKSTEKFN